MSKKMENYDPCSVCAKHPMYQTGWDPEEPDAKRAVPCRNCAKKPKKGRRTGMTLEELDRKLEEVLREEPKPLERLISDVVVRDEIRVMLDRIHPSFMAAAEKVRPDVHVRGKYRIGDRLVQMNVMSDEAVLDYAWKVLNESINEYLKKV